ncbi:fam-a protein [Plasmodium vinckei brucechwatti]|uniref:Fam-a protein n=1 Tax=Plasmodium vinckei brucechwatti TaxID=119398 RepID=A0A6V7SQG8_PLAVN|nr:fam-a protein [Plasmodium vinckei brucechwatti]
MNKLYITIALELLNVAFFMQNITFAAECASKTESSDENEIYRLYFYPEEAKQAVVVMGDALAIAQKHAKLTKDYKLYSKKDGATLHFKKVNDTELGRLEFKIHNPNSFDGIVNMLLDSNGPKNFYRLFIEGDVSRIYDDHLVIIQHNYKSRVPGWERHYHILANLIELSETEVAIVFVSPNMNGYNSRTHKKHVNPIVESANSFQPDVKFRENVVNWRVSKIYVNLVAFFIKKKAKYVKITHVNSIDLNFPSCVTDNSIKKITANIILDIVKLRDIFKKK